MVKTNRNRRKCGKFEKKGGFLNAKTDNCCAWTTQDIGIKRNWINPMKNSFCGLKNANRGGDLRGACCVAEDKNSLGDCDSFRWPKGPAFNDIIRMAMTNDRFYTAYLKAWKIGTENGWNLKRLS